MPSRLSTVNYALIQLGENPFFQTVSADVTEADILDNACTGAEKLCTFLYVDVAKSMLEMATWNWATQWERLTPQENQTPPVNWQYVYLMPNGWASTISIAPGYSENPPGETEYTNPDFNYEFFGGGFYADTDRVWINYIPDSVLPGQWSTSFEKAVAFEIALRAARVIRPSGRTIEELEAQADDAFQNAKRKDGLDQAPKPWPIGRWGLARSRNRQHLRGGHSW